MERSNLLQLLVIGALILLGIFGLTISFFPSVIVLSIQIVEAFLMIAFLKHCGIEL